MNVEYLMRSNVRRARVSDGTELAKLWVLLWPDASLDDHLAELGAILSTGTTRTVPMVIRVSHDDAGTLTGFLEVGLRSHADGCDPDRPVGFVEGWFVTKRLRQQGIGRRHMRAAEEWARQQGCREMASDAWIDHDESQRAHQALGFEVVDRCVHFRKTL